MTKKPKLSEIIVVIIGIALVTAGLGLSALLVLIISGIEGFN